MRKASIFFAFSREGSFVFGDRFSMPANRLKIQSSMRVDQWLRILPALLMGALAFGQTD